MTQQPHDFYCVCLNCQSGGVADAQIAALKGHEGREMAEEAIGEEVSCAGELGIGGTCETCGRERSRHVIIHRDQLEAVWEIGIVATICAQVNDSEVAVWVQREDGEPLDGCDEEFMRSISS